MTNLVNKYEHTNDGLKKSRHAVLDDADFKITFDILNKLTRDNPIFSFDVNTKQLINYLIEKM